MDYINIFIKSIFVDNKIHSVRLMKMSNIFE